MEHLKKHRIEEFKFLFSWYIADFAYFLIPFLEAKSIQDIREEARHSWFKPFYTRWKHKYSCTEENPLLAGPENFIREQVDKIKK